MTDVVNALVSMLAIRDSFDDLPPDQAAGTLCMTQSGVYVATARGWVPYKSSDERAEDVLRAEQLDVVAEYPRRWRCQLACGCIVHTVRARKDVHAPCRVNHWCIATQTEPPP